MVCLSLDFKISPEEREISLSQMLYKSESTLLSSQVYDQMPEPRYVISMGR